MKKRKFNIILITNQEKDEYNLLGEYDQEKGIIYYNESKSLLTEVKLNLKDKILIRDNKDYYLEYRFIENKETENKIKLKDLNQSLMIKIKTEIFEVSDNSVKIDYEVLDSNEKISYQIKF